MGIQTDHREIYNRERKGSEEMVQKEKMNLINVVYIYIRIVVEGFICPKRG